VILRGAIFVQISPFRAKSQFFANFVLVQILQFVRRYLHFPAKVRIFCGGAGMQLTFAQIGLRTVTCAKFI